MNFDRLFAPAIKAAKLSKNLMFRHGAALYVGKTCVSALPNSMRTHPEISRRDPMKPTVHAETATILSVRNKCDLRGSTLVVYRENSFGIQRLSKPCPTCLAVASEFGVKNIWYSTEDGFAVIRL